MSKGYLALVLHAHLPFVRHPEYEEFLEEDWLYEAITETYIPLLNIFEGLVEDEVPFKITMTLSPTLLSMLADPLLQERYRRHLDRQLLAGRRIDSLRRRGRRLDHRAIREKTGSAPGRHVHRPLWFA